MKDKQHITIHIADAAPLSLEIQRDKEEMMRLIEKDINVMWNQWRRQFQQYSSKDVLAMVAFRYAQAFYELDARRKSLDNELASAEKSLDDILLDVK